MNAMNPNDNTDYNPAEDDNQGVVQLLAQAQGANGGVPQDGGINPAVAQGPEPVKEEVNDRNDRYAGVGPFDTDANGVNDDMLAGEDVENGDVEVDNG